jgi:hypothetical protein
MVVDTCFTLVTQIGSKLRLHMQCVAGLITNQAAEVITQEWMNDIWYMAVICLFWEIASVGGYFAKIYESIGFWFR